MEKERLYEKTRAELANNLHFLSDKPEETADSSVKALWLRACGIHKSAKEAYTSPLPDLTEQQVNKLKSLVNQRLKGKPLAYITGRQSFMDIELCCDSRALIPRKETEILGQTALEIARKIGGYKDHINILDVCCGSGNLGLVLAHFVPNAVVSASDFSEEAINLAQENICFLNLQKRVKVFQSDLFSAFENSEYEGTTDLIVCNPPYISSSKVSKMDLEISMNEPVLAFDGGMLGTKIIQRLIREAPKFLIKDGWVVFEVGVGQGPFLIQLIEKTGLYNQINPVNDEQGNIRVICLQHKN
jgi:release factor glutamine methyltransferase